MEATDWRKNLKFRCTGCGKCCRETVVLVTDADVRRLVDGVGIEPASVVRFFKPDELVMHKRHPFWIRFASGPAVMGLRWENGHCRFLGANNLCTVYESRPVTCREYPFNVERSEAGKTTVSIDHVVDCPNEWDGKNSIREIKAVVTWNETQSQDYVGKVKAWNRLRQGARTRPAFLAFLGLA